MKHQQLFPELEPPAHGLKNLRLKISTIESKQKHLHRWRYIFTSALVAASIIMLIIVKHSNDNSFNAVLADKENQITLMQYGFVKFPKKYGVISQKEHFK